jgi:hypothetical protein
MPRSGAHLTRFQRINLWLGLAALALVGCMAVSQTNVRLGTEAAIGSAYGSN